MRRFDFLICYDISDKKRVSKVGRLVEREALRIQRSIYLYDDVTKEELMSLMESVLKLIDDEADDLRVYKITNKGIHLGSAVDLENPLIFNNLFKL